MTLSIIATVKAMTDERFLAIYEGLSDQGFGPLDGDVAQALKFRPHAIRKLPMEKRAKKARQILVSGNKAELAYELCGGYLLRTHEELMPDFLDATGVPHENGMIEDTGESMPDAAKIDEAVALLDGKYPSEDVTLYLGICAMQWPEIERLAELFGERSA